MNLTAKHADLAMRADMGSDRQTLSQGNFTRPVALSTRRVLASVTSDDDPIVEIVTNAVPPEVGHIFVATSAA